MVARKVSPDMAYKRSGGGVTTGALELSACPHFSPKSFPISSWWEGCLPILAFVPPPARMRRRRGRGSPWPFASIAGGGRNPYLQRTLASQAVLCSIICGHQPGTKFQAGRQAEELPSQQPGSVALAQHRSVLGVRESVITSLTTLTLFE